jgi:hypothetical protein
MGIERDSADCLDGHFSVSVAQARNCRLVEGIGKQAGLVRRSECSAQVVVVWLSAWLVNFVPVAALVQQEKNLQVSR